MRLQGAVEDGLWPLVEAFLDANQAAGVAVAVVRDDEVVTRGFGVRDVGTGAPVTPETMFHLASVSKPFVATAVVALGTALRRRGTRARPRCSDRRVGAGVHAGGRAGARGHGPGSPEPHERSPGRLRLRLARPSARRRRPQRVRARPVGLAAEAEPGAAFSYSNAGFELLGLLLSRVTGTTFEDGDATAGPATRSGCTTAPSCGARCPAVWPPHPTWGCRWWCPRARTPTPGATRPARPCTPTWSRCADG